jgi:hypothetical protein
MNVIDEIREGFASVRTEGVLGISSILQKEFPAYVIRTRNEFGVAVELSSELIINERFNRCRLYTSSLLFGGKESNYLLLTSTFEEFRYEFAALCTDFVDPGDQGANRISLLRDPSIWWSRWKNLMGNKSCEHNVYNVIAEMYVLSLMLDINSEVEWAASKSGSHDIECCDGSYEVKSTILRYGTTVTISSQYQLEYRKPLWICFLRLEESLEGDSINDMKDIIVSKGYDPGRIENELESQGFPLGASIRNKKYKIIEKRKYEVNDKFPRITAQSFKNDVFPSSILHIEYTVDLDGLDYTSF